MSDGPKLFFNKAKRSKLKQCQPSASMAPSTQSWSAGPVPPLRTPPQLPKESFARRYRFVWPLLLAVNFTVGAQLKQSQPSASMASSTQSSSVGAVPPLQTPPPPPKKSFARRFRFVGPLFLAVSFTVGAYLFVRTKKKDLKEEASATSTDSAPIPTTVATATVTVPEKTSTVPPPIIEPPKPREPIPENEQRELFKWILEEKRKLKPKDSEEKKRIDEEKALLKQFIRAKQLPSL